MADAWPVLCTAAALVALLVIVIRYQIQSFAALLVVSLGLGLAAGMAPGAVLNSVSKGVGDILKDVAILLALGAMLGRMLDASGAAAVIAQTLIRVFGVQRASFAILIAGYLIGIPILFNVGFLTLMPIMWRLQRETGRSLLHFALPLGFSLATTHSLVPPHPGIVGAVGNLQADMVQTMLLGTLMGVPIVLVGWYGPGRHWARRTMIEPPKPLSETSSAAGSQTPEARRLASGLVGVLIVLLPLVQSLMGYGAKLLADRNALPAWATLGGDHSLVEWLRFFGHPTMALLVPTGLAFLLLGVRRGMERKQLSKLAGDALTDVGSMALLFGAAGGFKQVIQDSQAGQFIARQFLDLPLSPVLIAFLVSALMRIFLGSATAAILTASALLAGLAERLPDQRTLLVLAVANGVTVGTQPADSGFWLIKEYVNLSVRQVLVPYNLCRITMAVTGLLLLLAWERWMTGRN
jgi:gluconate transporter